MKRKVFTTSVYILLFVFITVCCKKEEEDIKTRGFKSAREIYENPLVRSALKEAGIEVYLSDNPPNIEGEYYTHESYYFDASNYYSSLIGNKLASIVTCYDQTSDGFISMYEEFDIGGSGSGLGLFLTGYSNSFTIWQEAGNTLGQTVIAVISGNKTESGLDVEGLTIVLESNNKDEIGEWWAYTGPWKITGGTYVEINSPDQYSHWKAGETYNIEWEDDMDGNVEIKLLYANGNTAEIIVESTESDGLYAWTIPSNIEPHDNYIIKVRSIDKNGLYDESDNFEIIDCKPSVRISQFSYNYIHTSDEYEIKYKLEVTDNGGSDIQSFGLCWTTNQLSTTLSACDGYHENNSGELDNDGFYTIRVSGLAPNTTYYFKAFATNECNTGYYIGSHSFQTEEVVEGNWLCYTPNTGYYSNAAVKLRLTKFDASDFSLSYPLKITKIEHTFYWSNSDPWDENNVYFVICDDAEPGTSYSNIQYLYKSGLIDVYQSSGKTTYVYTFPEPIYVYDDFFAGIKLRYNDSEYPSSFYGKGVGDNSRSYFISTVSNNLFQNWDSEYCTRICVE